MSSPAPRDFTPDSGGPADVAPLGRNVPKPAHEQTADEDGAPIQWDAIAADPDFKQLLAAKLRFILPTTIFFVIYYFALPYLVGYHPELMKKKVWGEMNWAYLFALSQFFMAWIVAAFYVVVAAGWDRKAAAVLAKFKH